MSVEDPTLQESDGNLLSSAALREQKERSLWVDALRRFSRHWSGVMGLVILLGVIVLAVGAPLFTDVDPTAMNAMQLLQTPSAEHRFGTDDYGRDLFSRVLYGSRISLTVGLVVAGITTVTGVFIGAVAGFYPRLDEPIMRAMDILMALPTIMFALAIVAVLGPRLVNVIIALIFPITPRTARVVRGVVLALKQEDFVLAARCVGARDLRLIVRHVLPNCLAPIIVRQTYVVGIAILAEGGLNFLGVGVELQTPTLGGIVSEARIHLRAAPWASLYGGLFMALLVLSVNLLGDALRDVLDPRMKV